MLGALGEALDSLPDLERSITRILHKTASPSAFAAALRALASLPTILDTQVLCHSVSTMHGASRSAMCSHHPR